MMIFGGHIHLCKTSPSPPKHTEILLFSLIHQQRKSSIPQSQQAFIPPCDNPDPSKPNICLVFGVADSQQGIKKQQFPWSDVNLAQHVDFINHPASSVNLIGGKGCLSLAHFPPINIAAVSTPAIRQTLTGLCLDRQGRALPPFFFARTRH